MSRPLSRNTRLSNVVFALTVGYTVFCNFYGANRTGRWAGRLVQVQNLPQNKLKDLSLARTLVKEGQFETLDTLYENVPSVLSELIRTAFVPKAGHQFIVADFAAIEARVLAWLSGGILAVRCF